MGQFKRKRDLFFAEHRFCCFCGGGAAATERDHVPNRAFFHNRDWPVGYEFPACNPCQISSRKAELVIAALALSAEPSLSKNASEEIVKLYAGFANYDREAFAEFLGPERMSSLALPRSVQAHFRTPNGVVMNIGDRIQGYLLAYANKLIKALYYKHAGSVLPIDAKIEIFMVSNADIGTPQERLLSSFRFPGTPNLVRSTNARTGKPLTEQFSYTYWTGEKSRNAAFEVRFHQSFRFAASVNICPRG